MAGYTVNSDFARVYGDMGTGVWVGDKGIALPTTLTSDPVGCEPLGWLHDDGISFSTEKDVKDFNALQGGSLIRRKVGKVTQSFKFICLEETALVLGLVHAGQAVTVTAGVAKINIGDNQNRTVEKCLVVDTYDGAIMKRISVSAADITFQGEIKLASNDNLVAYEFEATMIAGSAAEMLTNSPGVIATP